MASQIQIRKETGLILYDDECSLSNKNILKSSKDRNVAYGKYLNPTYVDVFNQSQSKLREIQ
jgi:hypothetical protein